MKWGAIQDIIDQSFHLNTKFTKFANKFEDPNSVVDLGIEPAIYMFNNQNSNKAAIMDISPRST